MTTPDRENTAGTDPLVTVVVDVTASHTLRVDGGWRCACGETFLTLAEQKLHQAQAVIAAVRAHQSTTGQQAAVMFGEKRCDNSLQYRRNPDWYHNCDLILGHDGMHQEESWFRDDIAQGKIPVIIRWGTWESADNPDIWPDAQDPS